MSYNKNKYKKSFTPRSGRQTHGKRSETFSGTIQGNERGFAFIIPDDKEKFGKDFFVPKKSVGGAYDGDKVLAEIVPHTKDEARVIKILKRGNHHVTGTLQLTSKGAFVLSDNRKMTDIFIPAALLAGATDGDKVICEVTSYPKGKVPGGKIVEILGRSGDVDCEELAIIRAFELPVEFSDEALNEAENAAKERVVAGGRRDLRDKLIFTIDGDDTRDIDDAVSLEYDGKNYVLGVHIADVSKYVKKGSTLDREAYERGTSVYFPDKVLPMLPKSLSNGACSLNEGEDRYAMSCVMTFDTKGKRINYEIFKSVICSKHRTTYKQITAICEKDPHICAVLSDLTDVVAGMEKLCLLLEQRRENLGCVNMEVKEAHVYVDGDGEIVIPDYDRTISERMIEQFMVSANEAVAEFLQEKKAPCLYRIHQSPAAEKVDNFCSFLSDLGINAKFDHDNAKPKDFQNILKIAEKSPCFSLVNKVMLRSMQKARYSEKNDGHFGLASECYCHFTSPIRRYPDLFVHRALKAVLEGKGAELTKLADKAGEAGCDCSERERVADEAERKVDDLYKLAYMSERLGETFDATVSGVSQSGVYCELDNTIEGVILMEDLPLDSYELIAEKFLLKGVRRSFKLGDRVKVEAVDCDLGRMKVLFMLAG